MKKVGEKKLNCRGLIETFVQNYFTSFGDCAAHSFCRVSNWLGTQNQAAN